MKKTSDYSAGNGLDKLTITTVYPFPTQTINTHTTNSGLNPTRLSDLMLAILRCVDVDCWLAIYDHLDESELLAAHCLRDSYCRAHDLSHVNVLSSNGMLEVAWLFGEATLEAASTCAALYAYATEAGKQ